VCVCVCGKITINQVFLLIDHLLERDLVDDHLSVIKAIRMGYWRHLSHVSHDITPLGTFWMTRINQSTLHYIVVVAVVVVVATLTLAGWLRVRVVPGAVGLATDDPATPVVIAQVADEHHHGVVLALRAVDQPPPAVVHGGVADVLAGHRCRDTHEPTPRHIGSYVASIQCIYLYRYRYITIKSIMSMHGSNRFVLLCIMFIEIGVFCVTLCELSISVEAGDIS